MGISLGYSLVYAAFRKEKKTASDAGKPFRFTDFGKSCPKITTRFEKIEGFRLWNATCLRQDRQKFEVCTEIGFGIKFPNDNNNCCKFLVKAIILLFQNVIIQAQTYQDVDRLNRDKSSCKSASRVYTTWYKKVGEASFNSSSVPR